MIVTERLKIYAAGEAEMKALIAREAAEPLKAAYKEMLDGALAHPAEWDWYAVRMIELADGTHIGELCFKGISPLGAAELGYGIREEYQGRGFATEAVTAVTEWALQQPGIKRVEAEADTNNAASLRVLEKCGFLPTGETGEEGPRFAKVTA